MDKSDVIEMLKNGMVKVTFTKKDGTVREMMATLKGELLPAQTQPEEGKKPKTPNPDVLAVYEYNNGWRSFRWDSLISVNGLTFGEK